MARYHVYEAEEVVHTHLWRWTVEADSPEQAVELVERGKVDDDPEDFGVCGEESRGPSAFKAGEENGPSMFDEAAEALLAGEV